MPVLGAAGGVAVDDDKEDERNMDLEKDVEEDSWQDSSACSPLPGDPAPLGLVKTKVHWTLGSIYKYSLVTQGVFDLSKFMVGSDRESAGSGEEGLVSEPGSRPNSFSPPAKPPRIYDTPEGEDDIVYNDPVDMERNEKEKEEEELYESPVWSSSEIQSFAEQGRTPPRKSITLPISSTLHNRAKHVVRLNNVEFHPRPLMQSDAGPPVSVFQKPSLDEDSKLLPSDDVVQVASHASDGIANQDIESDFQTLQIGF